MSVVSSDAPLNCKLRSNAASTTVAAGLCSPMSKITVLFWFDSNLGKGQIEVTTQDAVQVTTQVKDLLLVLNTAMDRQEIQEHLNLANRENFRLNYLKPTLDAGFIEMTIPAKPNSRFQKYRLTALGEQLKKELISNSKRYV
jgi:hypothetical protein